MTEEPIDLVRRFCTAWQTLDVDAIVECFTDDAVWHNIPMEPLRGKDAIRAAIAGFTGGSSGVEFRLENIAAAGNVVLTERVDVFEVQGKRIEFPVMGAFEVDDGRITAWRDYFDMGMFTKLMQG